MLITSWVCATDQAVCGSGSDRRGATDSPGWSGRLDVVRRPDPGNAGDYNDCGHNDRPDHNNDFDDHNPRTIDDIDDRRDDDHDDYQCRTTDRVVRRLLC